MPGGNRGRLERDTTILPISVIYAEALKRDTAIICMIAPCYCLCILNQSLFNFRKLFSFPGQICFPEFSIQKLGVLSAKSFLRWLFAAELGTRLVGYQKLWGIQVGAVSILFVFELLIHISPISHNWLIGIRFLRIILLPLPSRRSRVGKLTDLIDEKRNLYFALLILYTELQLKSL